MNRRASWWLGGSVLAVVVAAVLFRLIIVAANRSAVADGHWSGFLGEGDSAAAIVVDIGRGSSGESVGEADVPSQGIEDLALEVHLDGSDVRLVVALPDEEAVLAGRLSQSGDSLSGRFTQAETDLPFSLVRIGKAQLSSLTLAMEGSEVNISVLSKDWRELRTAFNAAQDKTRLLMLLSPT